MVSVVNILDVMLPEEKTTTLVYETTLSSQAALSIRKRGITDGFVSRALCAHTVKNIATVSLTKTLLPQPCVVYKEKRFAGKELNSRRKKRMMQYERGGSNSRPSALFI